MIKIMHAGKSSGASLIYLEVVGECPGVEHVGELGERVGPRGIVRPGMEGSTKLARARES